MNLTEITPQEIVDDPEYQSAVELALSYRQQKDNAKFGIGDVACGIEKSYGKDTIGKFAVDINEPKRKVQDYRRVSSYWTPEHRSEFDEALSWSAFRVVMRFKDIEKSKRFLRDCIDRDKLTVDAITTEVINVLGKENNKPELWLHNHFCVVESKDGRLILEARDIHPDTINKLPVGTQLDVKAWEVLEDES